MTDIPSWIVNIGIVLAGAVFGYGFLRGKINAMEDEKKKFEASLGRTEKRLNDCFKDVDEIRKESALNKNNMATYLKLQEAEEKFVSKEELVLHLKNIELVTSNTNEKIDKVEGKLEDILDMLSGFGKGK